MAEPWRIGDRVRFRSLRGGVYIGNGQVQFPDGWITYTDLCEPDEDETLRDCGEVCRECGREHRSRKTFCINCESRPALTPLPAWVEDWWAENAHRYPSKWNPVPAHRSAGKVT